MVEIRSLILFVAVRSRSTQSVLDCETRNMKSLLREQTRTLCRPGGVQRIKALTSTLTEVE